MEIFSCSAGGCDMDLFDRYTQCNISLVKLTLQDRVCYKVLFLTSDDMRAKFYPHTCMTVTSNLKLTGYLHR